MAELVGVTGLQCSGKDTVAALMRDEYGFEPVTSSDVIRDYITANNYGEPTRPACQAAALELRRRDPTYIIRESLARCRTDRIVVSGLYSVAEARYFVDEAGGRIIKCDADRYLRYQLALARGRIGDDIDFEAFTQWEDYEANSTDPDKPSIAAVGKLAVITINNNGTMGQLRVQVRNTLEQLGIV